MGGKAESIPATDARLDRGILSGGPVDPAMLTPAQGRRARKTETPAGSAPAPTEDA